MVAEFLEHILVLIIDHMIPLLELMGVFIVAVGALSSFYKYVRSGFHSENTELKLGFAETLALALEFKMGGELLRTVIVREWNELLILGAIILLRAALTFLIQWEIKIERKNGNMTDLELKDIKTPLTQDLKKKKSKKDEEQNKQD